MDAWERFRRRIDDLGRDRTSGSEALARAGLAALADLATTTPERTPEAFSVLSRVRPVMAAIPGLAVRFLEQWDDGRDPAEARDRVLREADDAVEGAARQAVRFLGDARHVVTLSRSSTVLAALQQVPARVTVLASHPGGEGRATAETLQALGRQAEVVPDDACGDAVADADAVLVGADALGRHGVVNKTGTRRLARAAQAAGIPVTVAATSSKWHPWLHHHDLDAETADGTRPLFEATPWSAIHAVATDEGTVRPDDAPARLAAARKHWETCTP